MKYNNAFETDFCFGTDFCLGFAWQNPRQAFASLRPQKPLKALLCGHIKRFDDYRRVIGKLAFNYFAQFNAKIAVRQEFDKIRNFIRYGEDPEYWIPRIAKSQNSFLHILDDPSLKPIGHVITINKITELGIVLSELSIFNLSTYRVIISDKASNIINDIVTKGHFYNLKSKEITELQQNGT
jgi:hypothetical protein